MPGCDSEGTAERSYPASDVGEGAPERSYPASEVRAVAGRSCPTPKPRGGGRKDQPHIKGAVAARAQEGLEELSHVEGQEGQQ